MNIRNSYSILQNFQNVFLLPQELKKLFYFCFRLLAKLTFFSTFGLASYVCCFFQLISI